VKAVEKAIKHLYFRAGNADMFGYPQTALFLYDSRGRYFDHTDMPLVKYMLQPDFREQSLTGYAGQGYLSEDENLVWGWHYNIMYLWHSVPLPGYMWDGPFPEPEIPLTIPGDQG